MIRASLRRLLHSNDAAAPPQRRTVARFVARRLRLLTNKAGGPPVWPDLPPEILQANPAFLDDNEMKTKGWYPSPKAEQNRGVFT